MSESTACRARPGCRLCSHSLMSQKAVFSLPSTPLANSFTKTREEAMALPTFPLVVYACPNCGHHQLSVVVNPSLMFSNYAYASGTSASFRQHFAAYAEEMQSRWECAVSILEVGSNDGTLMRAMFKAGFSRVLGVEPAKNLAEKCREEMLNVTNAFFTKEVAEHPKFAHIDCWTANNVLAHVDDFVGILDALAATSAREGVFEVQYLGALLDGGMFDMVYHEHLDYWRATELVKHLHENTPWAVVHLQLVPTHGGSLRVWVRRVDAFTPGMKQYPIEHELVRGEEGHDWKKAWLDLELKMAAERKRLHALLGDNQRIAVYGVPAKLTSLLYGLKLTNLNFAYAVDDSPLKQGLYTPGMGLRVCSAGELLVDKPDVILVGAWNFAGPIKAQLKEHFSTMGYEVPIVVPFEKS